MRDRDVKVCVLDFETSGLEYHRPGFEVISCSFYDGERAWSAFGAKGVQSALADLSPNIRLAAHNAQFDLGVMTVHFPEYAHLMAIDTMRMVQVYDNGGAKAASSDYSALTLEDQLLWLKGELHGKSGLGLQDAASRILSTEFHNHKEPYYKYLRENCGVRKGKEGQNLALLPPEMLQDYNEADSKVTYALYEKLATYFDSIGYDWSFDHMLHMGAIRRIISAYIRGIKVDRDSLSASKAGIEAEMEGMVSQFQSTFESEIRGIEERRLAAWIEEPLTERGKNNRRAAGMSEALKFNTRSTTQLKELFVDTLGIKPTFWTKPGKKANPETFEPKPSFRAAHLPTYGDGGKILSNYKKRGLVVQQCNNLLGLSELDGRWHVELKACGTKTGRYTGAGSGDIRLNVQALARRDKGLMGALLADDGKVFVSIDLSAGEPSVIAHYSRDKNYRAACFEMTGKDPYWDGEVLMIDDPYLMFASVSPLGNKEIRRAWDEGLFSRWGINQDEVKAKLKKTRALHKTIFLALVYGQGGKGMVAFAADQGHHLTLKTAQDVHSRFWNVLFPKVNALKSRLEADFRRDGHLINDLGYRMVPEYDRLCLNYYIQSTVSGIMKVYEAKLFAAAPYAEYTSTVHDEVLLQIPEDKIEEFKLIAQQATDSLNADLGWSIPIRTGFIVGRNLYDAK